MTNVDIQIPKLFQDCVPFPSTDLGIEVAPLECKLEDALLTGIFSLSTSFLPRKTLLVTLNKKRLSSLLSRWIELAGLKERTREDEHFLENNSTITVVEHDFNSKQLVSDRFDCVVVTDAHILNYIPDVNYTTLVAAGEIAAEEHWFYKFCRRETSGHVKLTAKQILEEFPRTQEVYDDTVAYMSEQKAARVMSLEDIKVETTDRPDYIKWVKNALPSYCDYEMSSMHHDLGSNAFRRLSTERSQNAVIIGPRGSAKSTHGAEGYALYCICEGLEKYIIICSDSSEQAEKHVDVIKEELASNEWIKKKYPHVAGTGPVWKNNAIVTRNGIRIESLGAGKKIRGRRFKKYRPTLIIVDDPEGDDAAYSEILREHRRDWYLKGVLKAGSPTTNHMVIGSNIHMECLVSKLTKTPGFITYKYQSIKQWPLNMDLWEQWEQILLDNPEAQDGDENSAKQFYLANKTAMDEGAVVLWPEYESLYSLMHTRAVGGHYSFEAEKQNNPIDPSKCEWDPSIFPDVGNKNDPRWFTCWPEGQTPSLSVMTMDPSKGSKGKDKPTDFACILTIKQYGNLFYIDADMKRRTVGGCKEDWLKLAAQHKPMFSGIESVMFSELFCHDLFKPMHELGINPPVPIDQAGENKHVRIRRLDPYLRSSNLRYMYRSSGTKELISQCMLFPNGDHDDGPDTLEMGFRLMQMVNQVKVRNDQAAATRSN